jgi:hypothetical protein
MGIPAEGHINRALRMSYSSSIAQYRTESSPTVLVDKTYSMPFGLSDYPIPHRWCHHLIVVVGFECS